MFSSDINGVIFIYVFVRTEKKKKIKLLQHIQKK